MSLTRRGFNCDRCGVLLAPRAGTGVPLRPCWPGYEVQAKAPDGKTYLRMQCVHCDGPPPTPARDWLQLAPGYAGGLLLCLGAVAKIGSGELWWATGLAVLGVGLLAWTGRQRWRWRHRAER